MKNILGYLKKNAFSIIIGVIIVWLFIAFLIYPNVDIVVKAFTNNGKFSLSSIRLIFNSQRALKGLRNSIMLAITLSITVNIIGIFIVLVTEYFDIKGSKLLRMGYMTTLIYGGIVLVSGYVFVYGETGILTKAIQSIFPSYNTGWFTGYFGVVFVMTFSVTSNHMIFLRNAIKKVDYHTIEA